MKEDVVFYFLIYGAIVFPPEYFPSYPMLHNMFINIFVMVSSFNLVMLIGSRLF